MHVHLLKRHTWEWNNRMVYVSFSLQGVLLPSGLHLNHHYSQFSAAFQPYYSFVSEHQRTPEGCFTEAYYICLFLCLDSYCIGSLMNNTSMWSPNLPQWTFFYLKLKCMRETAAALGNTSRGKIWLAHKPVHPSPMHQLLHSPSYLYHCMSPPTREYHITPFPN